MSYTYYKGAKKTSGEYYAEKRNGLNKKATSIEVGTSRLEERAAKEWSRLAGEPVHVEEIGGVLYAFGSELACLRLWYKMGHGKAAPSKALVKERGPWYWTGR